MTDQEFLHRIDACSADIEKCVSRTLPVKAGNIAKDHFQQNFRLGGFVNNGLHKWKISKRINVAKGVKGSYKTLMSGRNHLYSSIEYRTHSSGVTIENRVPYAPVHNSGLKAGRGSGFTMPCRQFIGQSRELDDKITNLIETELTKILKL